MIIAVDIDDTLTNTFSYLQPCVAEFFKVSRNYLIKNEISYCNLPPEWKKRELEFCKAYFDKVIETTPFKRGASGAIKALKAAGHKIIIITGRDERMYLDPYKTTEAELKNGDIIYDKLICTTDKKSALKKENVSVLIDDAVFNLNAAKSVGVIPVMFSSKWNYKENSPYQRVKCWGEAVKFIKELEK